MKPMIRAINSRKVAPALTAVAACAVTLATPALATACSCGYNAVHYVYLGNSIPPGGGVAIWYHPSERADFSEKPPVVTASNAAGEESTAVVTEQLHSVWIARFPEVMAGESLTVTSTVSPERQGEPTTSQTRQVHVIDWLPESAAVDVNISPVELLSASDPGDSCSNFDRIAYVDVKPEYLGDLAKFGAGMVTEVLVDGTPSPRFAEHYCEETGPPQAGFGHYTHRVTVSCDDPDIDPATPQTRQVQLRATLPGVSEWTSPHYTVAFDCSPTSIPDDADAGSDAGADADADANADVGDDTSAAGGGCATAGGTPPLWWCFALFALIRRRPSV